MDCIPELEKNTDFFKDENPEGRIKAKEQQRNVEKQAKLEWKKMRFA